MTNRERDLKFFGPFVDQRFENPPPIRHQFIVGVQNHNKAPAASFYSRISCGAHARTAFMGAKPDMIAEWRYGGMQCLGLITAIIHYNNFDTSRRRSRIPRRNNRAESPPDGSTGIVSGYDNGEERCRRHYSGRPGENFVIRIRRLA